MKQINCPKCNNKILIPENAYYMSKDTTIMRSYLTQCPRCGKCIRIILSPSEEEIFNVVFKEKKQTKIKRG